MKTEIKQSFLDKIIGYFSPQESLARTQAKIRQKVLKTHFERKYEGAANTRRTENWRSTNADANSLIDSATDILRARSRDLIRNDPWAKRGVEVIENNVIGSGVMVEFDAPRSRQESLLNEAWKEWSETNLCDWQGLVDFNTMQGLIVHGVVESGEMLARMHFLPASSPGIPFQLEILEPDFINRTKILTSDIGQNKIISGIEVDERGRKQAYHLYTSHPGSSIIYHNFTTPFESVRIDNRFILHVYKMTRAGQLRGVPWLSNIMIRLREFSEYEDAQVVKQKMSACLAGFILDPDGATGLTDDEIEIAEKYEPGMINILGPGQDFKESNPPKVEGFDQFTKMVLHAIASGFGISYESLTGDLSETNFSSAKIGRQEMERNISSWRKKMFYPQFLTPVVNNFLIAAELKGIRTDRVTWKFTAPRKEMIQPDKEVPALIELVRAGLLSLPEAIRQSGMDPEKVLNEIEKTNAILDEKGLIFDSDARNTTKRGDERIPSSIVDNNA